MAIMHLFPESRRIGDVKDYVPTAQINVCNSVLLHGPDSGSTTKRSV